MLTEEQLGDILLLQSSDEFRLGKDALLLARFASLHQNDRVCDLGCGVGSLLMALAEQDRSLTLDGVEVRETAAALCRENLRRNSLHGTVITGDLQARYPELPWGSYDLVVANPPYFSPTAGKTAADSARALARTEGNYTLFSACTTAAHLCRNGGKFALCLRPDRLVELLTALEQCRFAAKRIQFVQPSPEKNANLVLVEAVRGGKPGIAVLPAKIER